MSAVAWFATGELAALAPSAREALVARAGSGAEDVREAVRRVIARVREEGDAALFAFARTFDGVTLPALEVNRRTWDAAVQRVDRPVRDALERAARNIADVHSAFAPVAQEMTTVDGVRIGRRPDALRRVGVYAPGGRAAYPSSVLMGVVPAKVAGVGEVIVCSPPEPSGAPSDVVLAAAAIAGADRLFAVGGAGAIAALAFGTDSIPRVDRIVGPGNAYVSEAKMQLTSVVGVDVPAGPSELLVLADDSASPANVARELFAQAEHDPHASVVVVGASLDWIEQLQTCVDRTIEDEPRAAIIRAAIETRGAALVAGDRADALEFTAEYAPEHLLLTVRDPDQWLPNVRNAGTVVCGDGGSVAFGDYLTGANHVLPTGGLARSYSGLSPLDFVRWTTYQMVDEGAARRLSDATALLAMAERLPAHAAAARQWNAK